MVKLTCGDYNGKYSEWKIMKNVILNVVFSLRLVYLRIMSVCNACRGIYIVVSIKITILSKNYVFKGAKLTNEC